MHSNFSQKAFLDIYPCVEEGKLYFLSYKYKRMGRSVGIVNRTFQVKKNHLH